MAVTISDNYQVKYTRKWGTLLQQHASRLDKYVSVMRDLSGKVVFLDQFGILDFTEKTTRVGQTVLNEAPTTRRSMRPRTFTKAIGYDEFDATRLGDMDLPVSKTIEGLQAAAGRRMDDVMISGFLGGIGGLAYVLVTGTSFAADVGGYGFLALAVMIFGNWKPLQIFFCSIFFALFKVVGTYYTLIPILPNFKGVEKVSNIYNLLPYVVTMIVLIATSKSSQAPKAEGIPYDKGSR